MRPKRRYIAFRIVGERVGKKEVTGALNSLIQRLPSSLGGAEVKPYLVFFEAPSQRGLLRCGHKLVDEVKAGMGEAERIDGKKARFAILGVSGTIRAAKRKFLSD
ncbi:MAG: Rpp14/Pop5 family protein [Candidatus Hodarchaeaceae archaeon]|nr:Rpp14/Pop5 family protein [Candidatus Hodarchaeaceae archaeon]